MHTFISGRNVETVKKICNDLGLSVEFERVACAEVDAFYLICDELRVAPEGGSHLTRFGEELLFTEKSRFSNSYSVSFPTLGLEFVCHLD